MMLFRHAEKMRASCPVQHRRRIDRLGRRRGQPQPGDASGIPIHTNGEIQSTQRSVCGSIANTSRWVVSINKYSPGRAGCIFPYGSAGRAAMSRLRFVLLEKSVNVGHSPEALRTLPFSVSYQWRCWTSSLQERRSLPNASPTPTGPPSIRNIPRDEPASTSTTDH